MTRKLQASKSFLRNTVDKQIATGLTIGNALTANEADFPNLPFKAADLLAKTEDLSKANTVAQSGDRNAKAALKTVREEWKVMYGRTADAVSLQADGSETIILKAGMKTTSGSSRRKPRPEQPANTVARPAGGKGVCNISVDAQVGVNGYVGILTSTGAKMEMMGDTVKIIPDGSPIYIQARSRRDITIDGLPSYTPFCASVFTFNSAGSSPLSNSEEMATQ